jgi:hypothetical protein
MRRGPCPSLSIVSQGILSISIHPSMDPLRVMLLKYGREYDFVLREVLDEVGVRIRHAEKAARRKNATEEDRSLVTSLKRYKQSLQDDRQRVPLEFRYVYHGEPDPIEEHDNDDYLNEPLQPGAFEPTPIPFTLRAADLKRVRLYVKQVQAEWMQVYAEHERRRYGARKLDIPPM